MPMSRSDVGTSVTSAPSMKISPPSEVRNPATRLSSVVLPQPDGPSSVMNSPRSTLIQASCSATVLPKRFVTPSRRTAVSAFDGCGATGDMTVVSAAMVDIQDLAQTEKRNGDGQRESRGQDGDTAHGRERWVCWLQRLVVQR